MGETIALIPARGGSTRIPRKNIRNFAGRPMIAWPIETANLSKLFDRIIVSTDDQEIAEIARQEGAEVPFIRPKELSDDITGVSSVLKHAILKLQEFWSCDFRYLPDLRNCTIFTSQYFGGGTKFVAL